MRRIPHLPRESGTDDFRQLSQVSKGQAAANRVIRPGPLLAASLCEDELADVHGDHSATLHEDPTLWRRKVAAQSRPTRGRLGPDTTLGDSRRDVLPGSASSRIRQTRRVSCAADEAHDGLIPCGCRCRLPNIRGTDVLRGHRTLTTDHPVLAHPARIFVIERSAGAAAQPRRTDCGHSRDGLGGRLGA